MLRPAVAADVVAVTDLVDAAYGHYVDRIGILPGPMREDYAQVIATAKVTVADHGGVLVGVLVLRISDQGLVIDNVAVHPSRQGTGLGRTLLEHAEETARRAGFDSIYLYTHEKMTENLTLYARIGYVEYERRSQGDFALVFMRKKLTKNP